MSAYRALRRQMRLRLIVTMLSVIGLASFTSEGPGPAGRVAAQSTVVADLADNTQTYRTKDDEEGEIIGLIAQHLKVGYETFDLPLSASILAQDFQHRYLVSENTVIVNMKNSYLEARKSWKKSEGRTRELLYSIRGIVIDVKRENATVVALSTYKSKYFNPRFIETLRFEKENKRWMLKRQMIVPLSPSRPDAYDVEIFVSPNRLSKKDFQSELAKAPDELIDRYRPRSRSDRFPPLDRKWRSVIFVFREPPPVGAKIKVKHQWWNAYTGGSAQFDYTVEKSNPYFVIHNLTNGGWIAGDVKYEILLDGKKIAEKRIEFGS